MTIPQRLRDIAEEADRYDRTVCNAILEIANELEAPPADYAVQARGIQEWADSPACFGLLLVLHRDHIATVAALQARINELEARQEQVRAFLDIAAGEGMELGGVDAGDLYVKMFGYPHPDTSKEQP